MEKKPIKIKQLLNFTLKVYSATVEDVDSESKIKKLFLKKEKAVEWIESVMRKELNVDPKKINWQKHTGGEIYFNYYTKANCCYHGVVQEVDVE